MKQWFVATMMVVAMAGFCGCDEEDETTSSGGRNISGTWNGTMQVTTFMGQTVAPGDSEVVPFTMNISQTADSITVLFQANGYPGVFSGSYYEDGSISFTATADYTYNFMGNVAYGETSMSGAWWVNTPGGMSGSWQASR